MKHGKRNKLLVERCGSQYLRTRHLSCEHTFNMHQMLFKLKRDDKHRQTNVKAHYIFEEYQIDSKITEK